MIVLSMRCKRQNLFIKYLLDCHVRRLPRTFNTGDLCAITSVYGTVGIRSVRFKYCTVLEYKYRVIKLALFCYLPAFLVLDTMHTTCSSTMLDRKDANTILGGMNQILDEKKK